MKKYEIDDVRRIGMRIKSIRALTGKSQADFCNKYSLSLGAFKTWESGKFVPRMANLMELCRCFEQEGIINVSTSWFLNGDGIAPIYIRNSSENKIDLVGTDKTNEAIEEINLFKNVQLRQKKNVIIITVKDDLMHPYFLSDDIVGGVTLDEPPSIEELAKQPFLIEARPNEFIIRWCFTDGKYLFFKSNSEHLLYRITNQKIGKILLHRRIK